MPLWYRLSQNHLGQIGLKRFVTCSALRPHLCGPALWPWTPTLSETPPPPDPPLFFYPSPAPNIILSSLWSLPEVLCSGFSGSFCETPRAFSAAAFCTTTRELQMCAFEGSGTSNTTKIPWEDPKWKKRAKMARSWGQWFGQSWFFYAMKSIFKTWTRVCQLRGDRGRTFLHHGAQLAVHLSAADAPESNRDAGGVAHCKRIVHVCVHLVAANLDRTKFFLYPSRSCHNCGIGELSLRLGGQWTRQQHQQNIHHCGSSHFLFETPCCTVGHLLAGPTCAVTLGSTPALCLPENTMCERVVLGNGAKVLKSWSAQGICPPHRGRRSWWSGGKTGWQERR